MSLGGQFSLSPDTYRFPGSVKSFFQSGRRHEKPICLKSPLLQLPQHWGAPRVRPWFCTGLGIVVSKMCLAVRKVKSD